MQASYTYYAKSFAYMNKLPWRYANHDKKKGWLWFHPGRPPGTILLAVVAVVSLTTHLSPVEEVGFWRTNVRFGLVPSQSDSPYLIYIS